MMSGGGGSGSTPNTPNSTTLPPISPIVSFLPQSAGGGLRYPLYATVQGNPLVYSPTMFGMPWRPLGPSGQVTSANTAPVTPTCVQNPVVTLPNLSALSQISHGGLVYPISLPMIAPGKHKGTSPQDGKKLTDVSESVKRRSETSHHDSESKRPRLSESIPPSPSLISSSPSSHPSTPPHTHKSSQPTLQQRSPVIKFIPYNPGQTVILPTNTGNPRTTAPQTIVLPAASIQPMSPQPLPKATIPEPMQSPSQQSYKHKHYRPQQNASGPSVNSEPGLPAQSTKISMQVPTSQLSPPALPDNLHFVLLKCFGQLPDSVLNHPNITVSSQLQDLYRQSYYATSTFDPLSPESACSLTICYLNALRPGEAINVENLRTMMHYAQVGETEWIQYYKKHKKMSESTYVQSQLMHLSRMSVYPTQGKVQVRTSPQSLGDGLIHTLYHVQYLATNSVGKHSLPEYVVVMAVHPSTTIDFCVLMLEPLQVLRLREAQLMASLDSKRRKQQAKLKQVSLSPTSSPFLTKLSLPKEMITSLQRFEKSLKGNVQLPFYCPNSFRESDSKSRNFGSIRLPASKAESLVPASSHVIEHKPSGPFRDQCNVAMILLQKILSSFDSETKIEQFKNIDFRVLCPPDASFVSQTISEVINSGLVDHLETLPENQSRLKTSGTASGGEAMPGSDEYLEAEAKQRIVCCNLAADSARFQALLNDLQNNKDTLFLIVVENAHMTTKIASKSSLVNKDLSSSLPVSDSMSLLSNVTNCVFLNVSSHPYSLQTNHSLVSPATNQIHWPTGQLSTSEERLTSQFCSSATFQSSGPSSSAKKQPDYGVRFREDSCFEELFHEAASRINQSSVLSVGVASLRAQLLLEEYVLSLLATVDQTPPTSCKAPQLETLALVSRVVQAPLLNRRGHGTMLIIRSHDVTIGHQFYHKLKATRDSLGLQFRFEVIFDDGSHFISLSDHFAKRISQRCSQGRSGHVTCYKELEGIPCIVVLAGAFRAGLTFPRSLCGVDLRLCFPVTQLTRTCYEYDTSLLNGHYSSLERDGGSETDRVQKEADTEDEPMETTPTEDTDSVFEITAHASPRLRQPNGPVQRTSSSSSSRKSSFCEEGKQQNRRSKSSRSEAVVISWHPSGATRASTSSASSKESVIESRNESSSLVNTDTNGCSFNSTGTVTVTIDPPKDDTQFYSAEPMSDVTKIPFTVLPVEESEDLYGDYEDLESDSEEEGEEMMNTGKVCLLSRPYYLVWSSQNKQQHLLLPPALGVSWCGGHRRPPLFDPDPSVQGLHYHKWSKPASSQDRSHLDSVSKETGRGAGRRFLLSGPPQVGKTGAWHLLVRLLHDHLRSSQGVVVETTPLQASIFLQDSSSVDPVQKHTSSKHSKIVTLEYLTSHLCNGVDTKEEDHKSQATTSPVGSLQTSPRGISSSTVSIGTSPYMAYDLTHSCNDCAQLKQSGITSIPSSEILTSQLPTGTDTSILIKWHIPTSQAKHCMVVTGSNTLYLKTKLPFVNGNKGDSVTVKTPVFIPTVGRDLTGLFNLFHTEYHQLQVLVTLESQFERYCKAWPSLIVMALPDHEAMGLGSMYHIIKRFAQYNFQLNSQQDTSSHSAWPMVAIMSDNIVMWKRISEGNDSRNDNISMSKALLAMESSTDCLHYAALSVVPWSEDLTDSSGSDLTDFDLTHDFIMLNLSQTAGISYNEFSFNSADIGFNLELKAAGLKTKLCKELAIVRKHLPEGGNMYPLHSHISSLCSDLDRVVISLHHDSSSHLPYPGPYLMEHYLLHKSQSLFPHALQSNHPVLVVDNYVTLGPQMHVTVVNSDTLTENAQLDDKQGLSSQIQSGKIRFGGLLLYLCEGKLTSEQLNKLSFVSGACLCLVTRDCKTLVREVARLDLEEKWKFRLRDEYQTACSDKMKPLFFLIGRYEG